jgi:GNAT superfamily N-acetyltransferase
MKFHKESYDEAAEDILLLVQDHWGEVDENRHGVLSLTPNLEVYKASDEAGSVHFYTMRSEEKLVGYSTFWIYDHPHYKGTLFAGNDMLYIIPAYRHTGYSQGFVKFCEDNLKASGVSMITYSMKANHRFEDLMESSGYEHTECVYSKFVGK